MKRKQLYLLLGLILLGVFLDQVSKIIVINTMELGDSITIIPNFFEFGHAKNPGISYGGFSDAGPFFFIGIYVLAIGVFSYLAKDINFDTKKLYSIAIIMMISGGIGNLIDRILFGEVTDFLVLIIFGKHLFGIFNIADVFLVVGMILFGIDVVMEEVLKWKKTSE